LCRIAAGGGWIRLPSVRRRLVNLAAGMSLVVCIVVTVIWVRSYWIADSFWWAFHYTPDGVNFVTTRREIYMERGGFRFYWQRWEDSENFEDDLEPSRLSGSIYKKRPPERYPVDGGSRPFRLTALGFQIIVNQQDPPPGAAIRNMVYRSVTLPLFFVMALTAILPAWWWRSRRRRIKRESKGLCSNATTTSAARPTNAPSAAR
jgi:hypothetical protein